MAERTAMASSISTMIPGIHDRRSTPPDYVKVPLPPMSTLSMTFLALRVLISILTLAHVQLVRSETPFARSKVASPRRWLPRISVCPERRSTGGHERLPSSRATFSTAKRPPYTAPYRAAVVVGTRCRSPTEGQKRVVPRSDRL
jgi:hypothetical protein